MEHNTEMNPISQRPSAGRKVRQATSAYVGRLAILTSLTLMLGSLTCRSASADLLFDNFEGTSSLSSNLSSTLWQSNASGSVVADPLDPTNHVLHFTQKGYGADLDSVPLTFNAGTLYQLQFDYLGTSNAAGGFVGLSSSNVWYFGAVPFNNGGAMNNVVLTDNGTWHHYSTTVSFMSNTTGSLMLQDWAGVSGNAGDAYFDNIRISARSFNLGTVPEPGALAFLFGAGLSSLYAFAHRKRRI